MWNILDTNNKQQYFRQCLKLIFKNLTYKEHEYEDESIIIQNVF